MIIIDELAKFDEKDCDRLRGLIKSIEKECLRFELKSVDRKLSAFKSLLK